MAITFPINPLHGQLYAPSGIPITWQFDSGRNAWRVVRTGTAWMDIVGKPTEFPPADHDHPISEVVNLQGVLDGKQDISARTQPNGYPSLDADGRVPVNQLPFGFSGDWNDIENKPAEFPPTSHTHPVAQISDSSSTGQQIVRAPTGADVRSIIGAIGPNDNARVSVDKNDVLIGVRRGINFKEGSNITMSIVDDSAEEEVEITINASGGAAGAAKYVVSEVKPVAPFDSDIWLDTATGIQFTYYNDGDTTQWIESIPFLSAMPAVFTKFNFPVAPIDNQLYNPIPGATWKWSATRGVWFAVTTVSDSYTKTEADAKFVDIIGDVMTGPLSVVHPPTANGHAASKQYVDSADTTLTTNANSRVLKAGDTMIGHLTLPTGPAAANAVRKDYVDTADTTLTTSVNSKVAKGGDTMSGHLTLPTGPAAANAVRKDYVDASDATLTTNANSRVLKAGDVMTGALALSMASPSITLNKNASGEAAVLYGSTAGFQRWGIILGDGSSESSGQLGSHFSIYRYNDAGVIIDSVLDIQRNTGQVSTKYGLVANGGISTTDVSASGNVGATGNVSGLGFYCTASASYQSDVNATTMLFNGSNAYMQYAKGTGNLGYYVNALMQWATTYSGGFSISGPAYRPGGGPWTDNSDARIKNVQGDYTRGLNEVATLRPVYYTFKGNDTAEPPAHIKAPGEEESKEAVTVPYPNSPHKQVAVDEKKFTGLIAQEVEAVFPEMVTNRTAFIDGVEVSDMRELDTTPLIFALVNAIKELKARIEVLES